MLQLHFPLFICTETRSCKRMKNTWKHTKQNTLFLRTIGNTLKSKHVNVNMTRYVTDMMHNTMLRKGKRLREKEEEERDEFKVLWVTVDTKKKFYLCTLFTGSAYTYCNTKVFYMQSRKRM